MVLAATGRLEDAGKNLATAVQLRETLLRDNSTSADYQAGLCEALESLESARGLIDHGSEIDLLATQVVRLLLVVLLIDATFNQQAENPIRGGGPLEPIGVAGFHWEHMDGFPGLMFGKLQDSLPAPEGTGNGDGVCKQIARYDGRGSGSPRGDQESQEECERPSHGFGCSVAVE